MYQQFALYQFASYTGAAGRTGGGPRQIQKVGPAIWIVPGGHKIIVH